MTKNIWIGPVRLLSKSTSLSIRVCAWFVCARASGVRTWECQGCASVLIPLRCWPLTPTIGEIPTSGKIIRFTVKRVFFAGSFYSRFLLFLIFAFFFIFAAWREYLIILIHLRHSIYKTAKIRSPRKNKAKIEKNG